MRLSLNEVFNLGNDLKAAGRLGDAEKAYRAVLSAKPDDADAICNLSMLLLDQGRSEEAIPMLRRGMKGPPPDRILARALLFQLPYAARLSLTTIRTITEEIVVVSAAAKPREMLAPDAGANRALRVGWLSADLRAHSVARTILPVCRAIRDYGCVNFFYSDTRSEDRFTEAFRDIAEGWRDLRGLNDEEACEAIRPDGLDVLFLLAARCDNNRPFFGAQRAASVQISLHDNATSALPNVDGFLADRYLVPRTAMKDYTERVLRLPSFYVHEPIGDTPDPGPPPCVANGFVTFGSFNNPAKISADTLTMWSRLLQLLPTSRLVLKYRDFYKLAERRGRIVEALGGAGVAATRVSFQAISTGTASHLESYRDVDIALDTFPYGGVTTTFEALWMGVPVVTLAGSTVASRQAGSMLRTLNLSRWVASDAGGYVAAAEALARDQSALFELRRTLRNRLATSPLCDHTGRAQQFARLIRTLTRGSPPLGR